MCWHHLKDIAKVTFIDLDTGKALTDYEVAWMRVKKDLEKYNSGMLPLWGVFYNGRI